MNLKKKTFDKILEDFTRIIKNRSRLGQKECFLNVPAFVMGQPLYNYTSGNKIHHIQDCVKVGSMYMMVVRMKYMYRGVVDTKKEADNKQLPKY